MNDPRWIEGLSAAMPVQAAGKRILELRFHVLAKRSPLAARGAPLDEAEIHRLRVAARRAGAALDFLEPYLPHATARRLRKKLRSIRRLAGKARDLDVLLGLIREVLQRGFRTHEAGLHALAARALALRLEEQRKVVEEYEPKRRRLQKHARNLADAWKHVKADCPVLQDAAARHLLERLGELEEAAAADPGDVERLHRLRIHGKRLRYAMELFGACFPPAFRTHYYPRVEQMQDILGRANDSRAAIAFVAAWHAEVGENHPFFRRAWRPGVHAFRAAQVRRLEAEQRRFRRFWKRWRQDGIGPGLQEILERRG